MSKYTSPTKLFDVDFQNYFTNELIRWVVFKYYLKHEEECFIRYKTLNSCFISDKTPLIVFEVVFKTREGVFYHI
jgi:hypothetical protein